MVFEIIITDKETNPQIEEAHQILTRKKKILHLDTSSETKTQLFWNPKTIKTVLRIQREKKLSSQREIMNCLGKKPSQTETWPETTAGSHKTKGEIFNVRQKNNCQPRVMSGWKADKNIFRQIKQRVYHQQKLTTGNSKGYTFKRENDFMWRARDEEGMESKGNLNCLDKPYKQWLYKSIIMMHFRIEKMIKCKWYNLCRGTFGCIYQNYKGTYPLI